MTGGSSIVRLRSAALEVAIALDGGCPVIVGWGPPIPFDVDDATAFAALIDWPEVQGSAPRPGGIAVIAEHASGFPGRPGLAGARPGGRRWAPRMVLAEHRISRSDDGESLWARCVDPVAELTLEITIAVGHTMTVQADVINTGTERYRLEDLAVTVPLPDRAVDLLSFGGRWAGEMQPQRRRWDWGIAGHENRAGRTSHEHAPLLIAGTEGFGEWTGEVWALHLAWSANHRIWAERLPDGRRYVQLGELLHPGEIVLGPGEIYRGPAVVASASSNGLTPASWGFHRMLRARSDHPTRPRPVLVNTWEAVYFDHDAERLDALAAAAAAVGVERFVLDDGWFGGRRDDSAGLGDWWVSPDAHPNGLGPLIEAVHARGMEFGIWIEPEMVNPDSDLYRSHPDWALDDGSDVPILARNQLVLDLARPEAFEHIATALGALLDEYPIAFIKWDMNRDHIGATGADGAPGTHHQMLAVERLWDGLRAAHPDLEIESCSSGGARIDLRMMQRAARVWASDNNDPLDRQRINHWTSVLLPPEVIGAHIGPRRSHTTGRVSTLGLRAVTAMFGHLGLELDLTRLGDDERELLRGFIELHKRFRPLLHGGDSVRFDTEWPYIAHGVYAADRREALVSWAVLDSPSSLVPPPLVLPGLGEHRYRAEWLDLPDAATGPVVRAAAHDRGSTFSGTFLAHYGIRPPSLYPSSAVLLHLTALDDPSAGR